MYGSYLWAETDIDGFKIENIYEIFLINIVISGFKLLRLLKDHLHIFNI